ncbi:MAG: KUP/HAK/KT family potassium transporter [Planctomycetota bacterium]
MITPAISVLSAVEGLSVVTPTLAPDVVPITIGILLLLFLFQSRGTARIGALFGPVTLVCSSASRSSGSARSWRNAGDAGHIGFRTPLPSSSPMAGDGFARCSARCSS